MSTDINDIKDTRVVSSCCGSSVYRNLDICVECKEHCTPIREEDEGEPVCTVCSRPLIVCKCD